MRPPERPPLPYPFFVKPVRGHLSQSAYEVDGPERLGQVLAAARAASFRQLIAEELLSGRLVTFEGFAAGGEITPIGVTDAVMHQNGISFLRFEYPSSLPERPQRAMADVARRLMPALGFDGSLFNIEFFVAPDGRLSDGRGERPDGLAVRAAGAGGARRLDLRAPARAGLRRPARVSRRPATTWWPRASCCGRTATPSSARCRIPQPRCEALPGAHIELLVREGQRLSENDDDVLSHRLAVIALSGPDRATARRSGTAPPSRCCASTSSRCVRRPSSTTAPAPAETAGRRARRRRATARR